MRILASLLLAPVLALAQGTEVCLPSPVNAIPADQSVIFGSPAVLTYNSTGVCIKWICYLPTFSDQFPSATQKNQYCGSWTELSKVGGRIETIQKATDPLKSLNNAGKRFPIVPLSDPSMDGMPK